jgi:predicted adenylyl cyclase CyaB
LKDSIEETEQKLIHLIKGKLEKVFDIYYYSDFHEKLKPKNNSLDSCLRIRQKGDKNLLAYKNYYFDENKIWLYSDEYESEFDNLERMKGILENLGFK